MSEKIYRVQMNANGMPNFSTAVEVADRPQGEWIDVNGDGSLWRCDQCKDTACCKGNFCPNCGCRMIGADDEVR